MSAEIRPRVLLADDHRMFAEGIKGLLAPEFDLLEIVEDGQALIEAAERLEPDVVVADITMPRLNGILATVRLKQMNDRIRVVLLTMHREVTFVRRAFDAGASAYVLKHSAPDELISAIRAALTGKTFVTPTLAGELVYPPTGGRGGSGDPVAMLTPRQREILQLVAEGRSAKEIATDLNLSTRTVEFHKYRIMEALNLHTTAELVHFAIKHGVVAI